jgi:hypothetical protein
MEFKNGRGNINTIGNDTISNTIYNKWLIERSADVQLSIKSAIWARKLPVDNIAGYLLVHNYDDHTKYIEIYLLAKYSINKLGEQYAEIVNMREKVIELYGIKSVSVYFYINDFYNIDRKVSSCYGNDRIYTYQFYV